MRYVFVAMLVVGLFALTVSAEVQGKAVAVVASGAVDSALVDRVVSFARQNSAIPIRLLPAQDVQGETLDEIGRGLNELKGADDLCLITIVWPTADISPHGVLLPDEKISVINAKALMPADGDAERYARRIERQVMQTMGLLLGQSACPNPQCALWAYSTDAELDQKGRNYCPPCLRSVQQGAMKMGITLEEGNPFIVQ